MKMPYMKEGGENNGRDVETLPEVRWEGQIKARATQYG